jgi:hypothetical protein
MSTHWMHKRSTRRLVWLLLTPALALRLLMPPGFMPGSGEGHGLTMQMCHGAGPLPTPAGHDGSGGRLPHDSPCVFAAAGTAAPPPVALVLHGGDIHAVPAPVEPATIVFHRAPPRAHAARAPPGAAHFA